ncbi:hypothetical protein PHYPSEUDO_004707 [Phytophthora pseudosyringae]|uniref:PLD phosphodiesterase domain-containing protein n=1 Tax=Phytophthora pseudosyringae TaxID=221518 RepID=A0A8T1VMW1_9STRA|nr:hypothetical protein PHYPSEUDO_004707 [Phytophthora pseudosyringae]
MRERSRAHSRLFEALGCFGEGEAPSGPWYRPFQVSLGPVMSCHMPYPDSASDGDLPALRYGPTGGGGRNCCCCARRARLCDAGAHVVTASYVERLRLHTECGLHQRENRAGGIVPDYAYVAEHSVPHRGTTAVRTGWNNGRPPPLPARRGRRPCARNDPQDIARRVWAVYNDTPHEGPTQVWRRVNAVRGEESISRTVFMAKFPDVLRLLNAMPNAVPQIRFLQPTKKDAARVIDLKHNASANGVIRVGSYALTYKPFVRTLIWLRINRPDVMLKVLYDRHWCWTNHQALYAICHLFIYGVETRHANSTSIHLKMIAVDSTYVFSGSVNFGKAGSSMALWTNLASYMELLLSPAIRMAKEGVAKEMKGPSLATGSPVVADDLWMICGFADNLMICGYFMPRCKSCK